VDARKLQDVLSKLERKQLVDLASRVAGFKLRTRIEYASAANISGVRNKALTFSSRRDSRTIFATDAGYGTTRKGGAWTGVDKPLIAACRSAMKAAGVPKAEIASVRVVSELGASAERLGDGRYRVTKETLLRKEARVRRSIKGLPVWSSSVKLGLTRRRKVGWLELHWPELPANVLREVDVLRTLVKKGFKPPELPDARVESIEAGIIHSPAIGFFMDVAAVIRVIYRGKDESIGRKPVLYLDRHGQAAAMPRDIVGDAREAKPRGAPAESKGRI
jgi:hypothetical protein